MLFNAPYDTLAQLDSDGNYPEFAPPASISLVVAGQTYQSQSDWIFQITVTPNAPGIFGSSFTYIGGSQATGSDPNASYIFLSLGDNSSSWPASAALPTSVPPSNSLSSNGIVNVSPAGSGGFQVQLNSWNQVPSLTISPASSSFIAQQNFDAVLLLSSQIGVTSMQASVGGNSIGFSYPGTCQLAQANNAQRTALICPNAAAVLATLGGGPATINWQITLADGSVLQQSVAWNLVL